MTTFFNFIILSLGIVLALFSIGLLIVIHEFGHYWVAKRFGVHIETFSLGFGRPLYQWRNKVGTLFKIGWVPLGGFVIPHGQNRNSNTPINPSISYAHKKNWQRCLIILAGPTINILFALIIYWGLFWVGLPYLKPVISTPPPNTPAFKAGLKNQDRILSINGQQVVSWKNLLLPILRHYGHSTSVPITVLRHNTLTLVKTINLSNLPPHFDGSLWQSIGLIPPLAQPTLIVDHITPKSAASESNLQPKDSINSINNRLLKQGPEFQTQLKRFAGSTVTIKFKRKQQQLQTELKVTQPASSTGIIMAQSWPPHAITILKYPFFQALKASLLEIQYNITLNAVFIKQLLQGYLSTHLLRGPISLLSVTTEAIAHGLLVFSYFMAYINIALAVFNLLPLPGLDGGHLILTLLESIRRKPLSLRIQRNWALTGFVLLASLLLIISLQDLKRIFL